MGWGTRVSFATAYPVIGSRPMRPAYVLASYCEKPSSVNAAITPVSIPGRLPPSEALPVMERFPSASL